MDEMDLLQKDGYGMLTGVELLERKDGGGTGRILITQEHKNPLGTVHGGCIFTLIDTVAGKALTSYEGIICTTVSSEVDFLNAARDCTELIATSEPVRIGSHLAVCDVRVKDEKGTLIAKASVTYYILYKDEKEARSAFSGRQSAHDE